MTTEGFVASHARDAKFERGLRSFYEYRDLGIKAATKGRVDAHVIRAAAGKEFSSQPHLHKTEFQLVYILKGWIEFEYEGQGVVRLEAGSCVHQPPNIRHRELGHSDDIEMLEVVLPAGFTTEEVPSVNEPPGGAAPPRTPAPAPGFTVVRSGSIAAPGGSTAEVDGPAGGAGIFENAVLGRVGPKQRPKNQQTPAGALVRQQP